MCLLMSAGQGKELVGYASYNFTDHPKDDILSVSFKVLDKNKPILPVGRILISISSQRRAVDSDTTMIRTGGLDFVSDIASNTTRPTFKFRAGDFYKAKENKTTGNLERVSCYPWEKGTIVLTFIPKGESPMYDVIYVDFRDRQTDKYSIPTDNVFMGVIKYGVGSQGLH